MNLVLYHSAIALTGTIGSGKSTVAQLLRSRHALTIDADELARIAVQKGSSGLKAIIEQFGDSVVTCDGILDRAKLAEIVFSDPKKKIKLEAITHPIIRNLAEERLEAAIRLNPPLIVYECPLLFETGLDKAGFKKIVLVTADDKTCLLRIMNRNGLTEAEAKARLKAQISVEEKRLKADIVLDNSGSMEELKEKVNELYDLLNRVDF